MSIARLFVLGLGSTTPLSINVTGRSSVSPGARLVRFGSILSQERKRRGRNDHDRDRRMHGVGERRLPSADCTAGCLLVDWLRCVGYGPQLSTREWRLNCAGMAMARRRRGDTQKLSDCACHACALYHCMYVRGRRPRGTEDRQTAVAARLRLPAGVGRAWHGLRALSAGTITSSATHGGIGIGRRPFQF